MSPDSASSAALRASQLVLRDLVRQGWMVRVRRGTVEIAQPERHLDALAEKDRVRTQLRIERDEQLASGAVRSFIRSMEIRRVHAGRTVSIFSLMRDGEELARRLEDGIRAPPGEKRERLLRKAIAPYLEFVSEDALCSWTGYKLTEIWRYFRHTWASPYRSIPGRSMMVLVRDAAVEPHAVIGIGALSSAAVQIAVRDSWIGWNPDELIEQLGANPTNDGARWLQRVVREALAEVYVDDLLEDGLLTRSDLRSPRDRTIASLEQEAHRQRELHQQFASSSEHKRKHELEAASDDHWARRARSHLFRSKRAELLATLLRAHRALRQTSGRPLTGAMLGRLLATGDGRRAVRSIIKRAKSERVGTSMAEITVCGAVAPYSLILGGKLVSSLLASPEVVAAYRDRYRETGSVIASSMAGRGIVRPPELVLLCTTSLYGVGSSQYNRLRMPCAALGGSAGEEIRFEELGKTRGYGTIHFSTETIDALGIVLARGAGGQRVNSIFGEGVSPRLRKVRDGLDALELPSELLLNHGSPRVVYGVPLARNFRSFLLGRDARPEYLLPGDDPPATTRGIADWWRQRWLARRIERPEVVAAVRSHRLVHPIRHGARVILPNDSPQLSLLEEEYAH